MRCHLMRTQLCKIVYLVFVQRQLDHVFVLQHSSRHEWKAIFRTNCRSISVCIYLYMNV